MVVPVGMNSQVQGNVQASHHEKPNDDYTLLSINNFHLSMNVNWRHLFCSQEHYPCILFHMQ